MELDLSSLDAEFNRTKFKPSQLDKIYFLFFENGTTLETFNQLPLPYIIRMTQVYAHNMEEQEKEYKKMSKK